MATMRTEEMTVNMGPHHPSTHGVLRFILKTDGEIIHECVPDVGYLHRSIEKIGELMTYQGFVPYTDRVDYIASMNSNLAYCMAVEKLAAIEVPRRAEFLRVMVCELNRISSHLIAVGALAMDVGAVTPFPYALRERERINDLLEAICGARLTYNYIWIGGVSFDMPPNWLERVGEFVESFERIVPEFNRLISGNKIFVERLRNVAVVPPEMAINYSLVGPNLRASGVDWDLRRDEPYSIYPELEFAVPVGRGERGTVGDCYDRFVVRVREMEESCKIIRQCIAKFPHDAPEFRAKVKNVKPPAGEVYVRTEAPRGEQGYYLVSDGSPKAVRVKIRTGSFSAMAIIEEIAVGCMIADAIAIIASLDVVAPEIDR